MTPLEIKFNWLFSQVTDMLGHIVEIYGYAAKSKRIIEFGVDDCTSTWILLTGKPEWLKSYDIVRKPEVDEVEAVAKGEGLNFEFINKSSLEVEIPECDLLFIDSFHSYEQLTKELTLHASKVSKLIILHDTTVFGSIDQTNTGKGLWPAVEEFIAAHKEWSIRERFTHYPGLTILERL